MHCWASANVAGLCLGIAPVGIGTEVTFEMTAEVVLLCELTSEPRMRIINLMVLPPLPTSRTGGLR